MRASHHPVSNSSYRRPPPRSSRELSLVAREIPEPSIVWARGLSVRGEEEGVCLLSSTYCLTGRGPGPGPFLRVKDKSVQRRGTNWRERGGGARTEVFEARHLGSFARRTRFEDGCGGEDEWVREIWLVTMGG